MDSPRREGGKRLRAFVRAHKGDRTMDQLARDAGLRGRQTLNEWFAGKRDVYLGSLGQLADALNVRRVDLVAAYDGVTPPETQKEPRPEWTEALMMRDEVHAYVDQIKEEVITAISSGRDDLIEAIAKRVAELAAQRLDRDIDDEGLGGTSVRPKGPQEPQPPRST